MRHRVWSRPPSPGDVLHVARNMRVMDVAEILLMLRGYDTDLFAAVTSTMVPGARLALGIGLDENPFCAAVLLVCSSAANPWLANVSMFATDDFPLLAPWLLRFIRKVMVPGLLADGVRRVECRALASYAVTRRFLKAAGATEEALLPDQGPNGEPYVLCAWRRCDFVKGANHVL